MICHLPERTGVPPSFSDRLACVAGLEAVEGEAVVALLPDREAPLLEEVDGIVDVAAEVVDQVLAGDAHEVVADVLDVVRRTRSHRCRC